MKKNYLTNNWLDLLTYIILPIVTIIAVTNVIKGLLYSTFSFGFVVALISELIFIALYILTFVTSIKRTKPAYFFLRLLVYATAFKAALDFSVSQVTQIEPILAFLFYFLVVALLWIYPNEKYLKKRKNLFNKKSSLKYLLPAKDTDEKDNKKELTVDLQ